MSINSNTIRPVADPDVKIPDAVKAAGAAADALHSEIYNQSQDEPPADPAIEEAKPSDPPLTAEPPVQEVTPHGNEPDDETWKHKYNSMKGRHDRLQQQMQGMSEQIQNLQGVIASLQARQPVERQEPAAPPRLITPEEENDYGTDFLNVVGKKAKQELLPEVQQLKAELAELKSKYTGVTNVIGQESYNRMLGYLDNNIEDWRVQNNDPEFISWLKLPDPFSGVIRQKLLMDAWEAHEAPRVATIFKGFLAEEAAVAPARGKPDPTPSIEKVPLESLAAPGRAKTAAGATPPAEKPILTQAQITQFYADVAARRYEGREAEKERFEREIFSAQKEGRIR